MNNCAPRTSPTTSLRTLVFVGAPAAVPAPGALSSQRPAADQPPGIGQVQGSGQKFQRRPWRASVDQPSVRRPRPSLATTIRLRSHLPDQSGTLSTARLKTSPAYGDAPMPSYFGGSGGAHEGAVAVSHSVASPATGAAINRRPGAAPRLLPGYAEETLRSAVGGS